MLRHAWVDGTRRYSKTNLVTSTYDYDAAGQLLSLSHTSAGGTLSSFDYTYDAEGNRAQMVSQMPSGQVLTTTYGYDIANCLTSVVGVTYTWDANGNLLDDGLNTYTYDQANRLITLISMPPAVTFTYNGLGDRLQ